MADNNCFAQLADFQFNIDSLNTVLLGDDNTSVTIDGVTKPSISKALNDKFNNAEFGLVVFQTYAQLDAHTPLTTERKGSFKVANDSNRALNGYYAWVSGTTYTKDASLVINTIDPDNTSDAVSGSAVYKEVLVSHRDLYESEYYAGNVDFIRAAGSASTSGALTWILDKPASTDHVLSNVKLRAIQAGEPVSICVFERVNNLFIIKQQYDFITVLGLNNQDLILSIFTGEYVGLIVTSGTITYGDNAYTALDWFTRVTATSSQSHKVGCQFSTQVPLINAVSKIASKVDDSLTALKSDISTPTFYDGSEISPDDGQNASTSGYNFILPTAATSDQVITRFEHGGVTQSGVWRLRAYSRNDSTFRVQREVEVVMDIGSVDVLTSLILLEGEYLGAEMTTGQVNYNGTGATKQLVFLGSGLVFTDDGQERNYGFHWKFYSDTPTVIGHEARISSIEDSSSFTLPSPFKYSMILGIGQSLMEGSWYSYNADDGANTPITTTQEYDTLGFSDGNIGVLQAATVDTTERGDRGEWSGLGCAAYLKELISTRHGVPTDIDNNTMVITNDGYSGSFLSSLSKGNASGRYSLVMSKVSILQSLVGTDDAGVLAIIFMQGEADAGGDKTVYKSNLIKLVRDYNLDIKAATGQTNDVVLFSYQVSTYRNMAITHLEASDESEYIKIAMPMYHLPYYNNLHINAISQRLAGAYFAKAINEVQLSNNEFEPLRCIDARLTGNSVIVTFNRSGLVLDTTLMPLQTNYGFFVNDGNSDLSITEVKLLNQNQVKITLSVPVESGWTLGYGTTLIGGLVQQGAGGNLRDNSGIDNEFDNYPLHDWCVIFDYEI